MQAAEIQDAPVGRLFDSASGGTRSYAMAVPLYDAVGLELPRSHPARRPVAVLGMRRDTGYIDAEVAATARRIVAAVPVRRRRRRAGRLVRAAPDGGAGRCAAWSRASTPSPRATCRASSSPSATTRSARIAGRFNAMTGSLREAREEGERASSARLALEARLRHAEKLATIGQMAAEIAHEVGTPLNVIGGRRAHADQEGRRRRRRSPRTPASSAARSPASPRSSTRCSTSRARAGRR